MSNLLFGVPIGKQSAAAVSSLVVLNVPGSVNFIQCNNGAAAGYLMVFDAITAPVDGAVTPLLAFAMAANSTLTFAVDPPVKFTTGCTLVYSSTGPNTKTASATAYFVARQA